jgi:hypothetical protein
MNCTGRFADAEDYLDLFCNGSVEDLSLLATINGYLDIAASDIHMALSSIGACDCTLSAHALQYLKKLNIIDAARLHNCPCARITDEQRRAYTEFINDNLRRIISGEIELCDGYTGSMYPAYGTAEIDYTVFSAPDIIIRRIQRTGED